MDRKASALAALALLAALLYGCAAAQPLPAAAHVAASSSPAAATQSPAPAQSGVYADRLEGYFSLLCSCPDEFDPQEGETGVYEVIMGLRPDEALASIGYAIEDINADGSTELLIGAVRQSDAEAATGSEILALYTCANGAAQYCFEGWGRSRYSYIGEGAFLYEGSEGATHSMFGSYTLSKDGKGLNCTDFYFTYESEDDPEVICFYHNTTGEWDPAHSVKLEISEELFWQTQAVYEENIKDITLIPFSEYKAGR